MKAEVRQGVLPGILSALVAARRRAGAPGTPIATMPARSMQAWGCIHCRLSDRTRTCTQERPLYWTRHRSRD